MNPFDDIIPDEPNPFDDIIGPAASTAAATPPIFSSSADQESFFTRLTSALTDSAQTNPLAAMALGGTELAQRSGTEISEGLGKVAGMPIDFTNPANIGGIAEGLGGALQAIYAPVTSLGNMTGEATLEVTGSPAAATVANLGVQVATGLRFDRALYKGGKALADKLDDLGYRYPKAAGPTPPPATEVGIAADPAVDDVLKSTPPTARLVARQEDLLHGTSEENFAQIMASGKLDSGGVSRPHQYDYSEFGPDAVYAARQGTDWFGDKALVESGRMIHYPKQVPITIAPGARVRRLETLADWEALARELGTDGKTLANDLWVENLQTPAAINLEQVAVSKATVQRLHDRGIDVLDIGPLFNDLEKDPLASKYFGGGITGNQVVFLNPDAAIVGTTSKQPPSPEAVAAAQQALAVRGQAVAARAKNLRDRIYEAITEKRERLTPQWFGRLFHENYGHPEAYVQAKRASIAEHAQGLDEAQAALTDLSKDLPFTTRKAITAAMVSGLDEAKYAELRRIPGVTDEMVSRVLGVRATIDRNSAKMLELGIPDETKDTIAANLGKYLPRVYRQYFTPDFRPTDDVVESARNYLLSQGTANGKPLGEAQVTNILDGIMMGKTVDPFTVGRVNPQRINSGLLKKRKDIPQELQDLMGVFTESGVPEAKAIASQTAFIAKHKFFQGVATNADWTLPDALVTNLKGSSNEFLGSLEVVHKGVKYKKMPETGGVGPLKGKYVQEFIADDLNAMNKEIGEFQKNIRRAVSEFKLHKTVLSVKTHFRNTVGNAVLLNISGVSLPKIPVLLGRSIQEMAAGETLYQRMIRGEDISALMNGVGGKYVAAKKSGLFASTFTTGEINAIAHQWESIEKTSKAGPMLGQLWKVYDGLKRKAGGLYQAEEAWFKMAKVIDEMDKGATIQVASDEARRILYDYSEVSKAVEGMRRGVFLGSPFITFTAKTLPRVAEASIRHPVAFWKWPVMFAGASAAAAESIGLTDRDYANLLKKLPDYIRKGSFLLLPYRDRKGHPQFVDFTYLMPWGQISEIAENVGSIQKEPAKVFQQFLGPAGNLAAAFAPALQDQDPKDPFTGRRIYRRGERGAVKLQKALNYVYTALLSPLVPGIPGMFEGGYDFRRVTDAVRGVAQNPNQEPMSVPAAVGASVFGVKATPVDPAQVRRSLGFQYRAEVESIKEVIYDARRRGDTVTVKEETARLQEVGKEYNRRLAEVKQDEANQFKNFYRDFRRSFGVGTGP